MTFIKSIYYYLRGDICHKCGTPYEWYGSLAYWCPNIECPSCQNEKNPKTTTVQWAPQQESHDLSAREEDTDEIVYIDWLYGLKELLHER